MPAKIRRDIRGPHVIGGSGRAAESSKVWDLGTLGTKQLRLHSQSEPHTGEKPLEAKFKLSRIETLEETKREILDGNGGREQRTIISECTVCTVLVFKTFYTNRRGNPRTMRLGNLPWIIIPPHKKTSL